MYWTVYRKHLWCWSPVYYMISVDSDATFCQFLREVQRVTSKTGIVYFRCTISKNIKNVSIYDEKSMRLVIESMKGVAFNAQNGGIPVRLHGFPPLPRSASELFYSLMLAFSLYTWFSVRFFSLDEDDLVLFIIIMVFIASCF